MERVRKHHIVIALWFIGVSIVFSFIWLSNVSIKTAIINDTGIIRGGAQRVVKSELYAHYNNSFISEVDSVYQTVLDELEGYVVFKGDTQKYVATVSLYKIYGNK